MAGESSNRAWVRVGPPQLPRLPRSGSVLSKSPLDRMPGQLLSLKMLYPPLVQLVVSLLKFFIPSWATKILSETKAPPILKIELTFPMFASVHDCMTSWPSLMMPEGENMEEWFPLSVLFVMEREE